MLPAPGEELPHQPVRVAGVIAGRDAGYHEMKGVAEALERALRVQLEVAASPEPFLHPGRSARLGAGGTLGELHPLVAREFGMEEQVSLFEIDLAELETPDPTPLYRDVVTYPPVRQDIAVVVASEVTAAEVLAVIRAAGGELLAEADVFDTYRGEQVGEGRQSVAVHLQFQARRSHADRCRGGRRPGDDRGGAARAPGRRAALGERQPVVPWVATGRTSATRDSSRSVPLTPTLSSVASRLRQSGCSRAVAERVRGAEAEDAASPVPLVPGIQRRQHERRLLALVRVEQLQLDVHRRPILGLACQNLIPLFGELLHWRPS